MNVSVNISLEPGYRPGIYTLDVHALWSDGSEDVAQRDILYTIIPTVQPGEDTDLRVWLVALMRAAAESAEHDLIWSTEAGKEKLTLADFKPIIT